MHFFKTFVYSDTLQTFLSHLHNLFRVRRPSSAPYLKPLSNDWHSVGIDGLNCGQRLLEEIDRQNLDISDADFYLGVYLSENLNNFHLVRVLFDAYVLDSWTRSNNTTSEFYLFLWQYLTYILQKLVGQCNFYLGILLATGC